MEEEKKVRVVSKDTLNKIVASFATPRELMDFGKEMNILSYQIFASSQAPISTDDEAIVLCLRQIVHFASFCKENIEIVRQLIHVCSVEEFTESELEKMNQPE